MSLAEIVRKRGLTEEVESDFEELGPGVSVFVLDLAHFTKITREHGIEHMASVIMRMRQIALDIVHRIGDFLSIFTEADNLFVSFSNAESALNFALTIEKTLKQYNESLNEQVKHFSVTLGGIGLDISDDVVLKKNKSLQGSALSAAFLLGEDVAENEVLVTARFAAALSHLSLGLEKREPESDEEQAVLGGHFFKITSGPTIQTFQAPDFTDTTYIEDAAAVLTIRHKYAEDQAALARIDSFIARRCFVKSVVLMFALEHMALDGAATIRVTNKVLDVLQPVWAKYHGVPLEHFLILFEDEGMATAAALAARQALLAFSAAGGNYPVRPKGFGIHSGTILYIPNTNIHWGDAVNTASKLGEDLAIDQCIFISDQVYKAIKQQQAFDSISFEPHQLKASGVSFTAQAVTGLVDDEILFSELADRQAAAQEEVNTIASSLDTSELNDLL